MSKTYRAGQPQCDSGETGEMRKCSEKREAAPPHVLISNLETKLNCETVISAFFKQYSNKRKTGIEITSGYCCNGDM